MPGKNPCTEGKQGLNDARMAIALARQVFEFVARKLRSGKM